jgi:threonine/homoserine/homoserine lactone efflux protein
MKLSWIFGSSMEAHHLLASYLIVWLIQGGYAAWIAWQWWRAGKALQPDLPDSSEFDEGS